MKTPKTERKKPAVLPVIEAAARAANNRVNDYPNLGVNQIVSECARVYEARVRKLRENGMSEAGASQEASEAWQRALPDLVDRRTALAYIACVAWGCRMALLTGQEAKTMMFIAQTQLTLLKQEAEAAREAPRDGGVAAQVGQLFGSVEDGAPATPWPGVDTGGGK